MLLLFQRPFLGVVLVPVPHRDLRESQQRALIGPAQKVDDEFAKLQNRAVLIAHRVHRMPVGHHVELPPSDLAAQVVGDDLVGIPLFVHAAIGSPVDLGFHLVGYAALDDPAGEWDRLTQSPDHAQVRIERRQPFHEVRWRSPMPLHRQHCGVAHP